MIKTQKLISIFILFTVLLVLGHADGDSPNYCQGQNDITCSRSGCKNSEIRKQDRTGCANLNVPKCLLASNTPPYKCLQCLDGFTLNPTTNNNKGSCEKKSQFKNCLALNQNNLQQCGTCILDYVLTQNRKSCGPPIPNCQQLKDTTDKCAQCKDDYFSDGTDKACISSTADCAPTFFNDGSGEKCVEKTSQCLKDRGYYSNGLQKGLEAKCISNTEGIDRECFSNSTVHFFKDGSGLKCIRSTDNCVKDLGYFSNGIREGAEAQCISDTEDCYKNSDENIYFFDDGSGRNCTDSTKWCMKGWFDNGQGTGCIRSTKECLGGTFNDGTGQRCIIITQETQCTTGYTSNGIDTACIPDSKAISSDQGQVQVLGCEGGSFDDGSGKKCIFDTKDCIQGFFDDGTGARCIHDAADCQNPYFNDGSNTKCISDTQECLDPYFDDGTGRKCISDTKYCALNHFDDGSGGHCIDKDEECVRGYFSNGPFTACISDTKYCADTYFDDGSGENCVDNVDKCLKGLYFNDGSFQRCVSTTKDCVNGWVGSPDKKKCIPPPRAPTRLLQQEKSSNIRQH